jgi:hypothetical protein
MVKMIAPAIKSISVTDKRNVTGTLTVIFRDPVVNAYSAKCRMNELCGVPGEKTYIFNRMDSMRVMCMMSRVNALVSIR